MIVRPYNMCPGGASILYYSLLDQGPVRDDMPGSLQGLINICGTGG